MSDNGIFILPDKSDIRYKTLHGTYARSLFTCNLKLHRLMVAWFYTASSITSRAQTTDGIRDPTSFNK